MVSKNSKSKLVFIGIIIAVGFTAFLILNSTISPQGDLEELSLGLEEYLESSDKKIRAYSTQNQLANEIRQQCGNDEYCIVEKLQNLSRKESSEVVLHTAGDLVSGYKKNGIVCHNQGHHIGEFLYGQIGDLKDAILQVDNACGGSLYHGILESYMRSEIFFEGLTPSDIEISNVCKDLDDLNIQVRTECHHGLGHALAIVYDFDVASAAKRCDEFDSTVEQRFCHEGVFMENTQEIIKYNEGAFDEDDILNPCNRVEDQYVRSCYYHHASYLLKKTGSADEGFAVCDTIPQDIGVRACYLGMGRQLASGFFDNMDELELVCNLGQEQYQTDCFAGSLLSILDDLGTEKGFETCKEYPQKEKPRCYGIMGKWVYTLYSTEEERKNYCSNAENQEYYQVCISQVADT